MTRFIMDSVFEQEGTLREGLAAYKQKMQDRWNCFYDESERYVKQLLVKRNPLTHEEILTVPFDYYHAVVSKLGADLDIPELKFNGGSEEEYGRLRELLKSCKFSDTLRDTGLMMELLRTVGVQVSWDMVTNKLQLTVTPPMQFDVRIPDGSELYSHADALALYGLDSYVVWEAAKWTKGSNLLAEGDQTSGPNDYGILPFAVFQATDAGSEFWKTGGQNLYSVCMALSYHWSDVLYTGEFQSHAIPVFTGMTPADAGDKIISPSHGMGLTEQQTFDFKAPPDASAPRREMIRAAEESLSYLYDLPSETFDKTLAPASGVAREIAYAGLMKRRTKLALRIAWQSGDLLRRLLKVYNTHVPERDRFSEDIELLVVEKDWIQRVKQDPNEKAVNDRERIAMNLISPVDVIMEERGVDRAEALRIFEENKRLNAPPVTAATAKASLLNLGS